MRDPAEEMNLSIVEGNVDPAQFVIEGNCFDEGNLMSVNIGIIGTGGGGHILTFGDAGHRLTEVFAEQVPAELAEVIHWHAAHNRGVSHQYSWCNYDFSAEVMPISAIDRSAVERWQEDANIAARLERAISERFAGDIFYSKLLSGYGGLAPVIVCAIRHELEGVRVECYHFYPNEELAVKTTTIILLK